MSRPGATHRRSTKTEYIETDTGNKISRRALIEGKQNIMLGGKSVVMAGVHMRGDLHRRTATADASNNHKATTAGASSTSSTSGEPASKTPVTAISIGRATVLATGCTLHPPMRVHHGAMTFYPMRIGDNVFIGAGSYVAAASISSHVHVGAGCVLSAFCVIRESVRVMPGTVVPPNMVVPAGCIVAGRPARIVGEVGDAWGQGAGVGDGEEWVEGGDLRALVRSIK